MIVTLTVVQDPGSSSNIRDRQSHLAIRHSRESVGTIFWLSYFGFHASVFSTCPSLSPWWVLCPFWESLWWCSDPLAAFIAGLPVRSSSWFRHLRAAYSYSYRTRRYCDYVRCCQRKLTILLFMNQYCCFNGYPGWRQTCYRRGSVSYWRLSKVLSIIHYTLVANVNS